MATTKANVRKKVVDMIENDLSTILIEKLDYLLDSGAINFDNEDDNYKLPKHIMQALGNTMSRLYSNPHATRADKKQIKNFNYFI
jgi:hypothetical protein